MDEGTPLFASMALDSRAGGGFERLTVDSVVDAALLQKDGFGEARDGQCIDYVRREHPFFNRFSSQDAGRLSNLLRKHLEI